MLKRSISALLLIALAFASGCGGKTAPKSAEAQTPNIRIYPIPFQQVWKTTLETVEFEFLMGIEVQEIKRGFFSTELIRDYQPFQKRRFRLSGTLVFDGQGTIVKLYKHEELFIDNDWKAIPSDNKMEAQVLDKISRRFQTKK